MIECLEIDRSGPRPDRVREVVKTLRRGGLVACPTDTTYGVFASAAHPEASARLTRLRERMAGSPSAAAVVREKPLSLVFSDLSMLAEWVVLSGPAFKLVKRLLPGPYTVILPASRAVPKALQTKRRSVGARIPDDTLVQAIVSELGGPVLTTTVKSRQGEPLGSAIDVQEAWPREIDVVVDAGDFSPQESTVLSVEGSEVTLVREGKGRVDLS